MFTLSCEKLIGVVEFRVMPAPLNATVDAPVNVVFAPVIVTSKVWPCWPVGGITVTITGGGSTVKGSELMLVNAAPPVYTPESEIR